ncbi:MAG: VOC family protein [Bdellovibrionales bacterium]|nr:VOC family protein [Bdellovibrionales bacterium]
MNISEYIKDTYGTMYYVTDMQKAASYYKNLFNLSPEEESPGWTTFNLNGHRICLHATEGDHSVSHNGVLITNVSQLENVVAELKNRGVEFVKDITEVCEGGYSADFVDPSGNVLSLFEYKG